MRAHGTLNAVGNDEDEHGFHLILLFDSDDCDCEALDLRVDFTEGQELLKALEPLRDWVNEGLREYAAYQRASDAERAEVLGLEAPESAYALDDPKHETYRERMADVADRESV